MLKLSISSAVLVVAGLLLGSPPAAHAQDYQWVRSGQRRRLPRRLQFFDAGAMSRRGVGPECRLRDKSSRGLRPRPPSRLAVTTELGRCGSAPLALAWGRQFQPRSAPN
jgi:hypothetical protein